MEIVEERVTKEKSNTNIFQINNKIKIPEYLFHVLFMFTQCDPEYYTDTCETWKKEEMCWCADEVIN